MDVYRVLVVHQREALLAYGCIRMDAAWGRAVGAADIRRELLA